MTGLRVLWLGTCIVFTVAVMISPAVANPAPPPEIIKKRENPTPPQIDPETGAVVPVKEAPTRRTGPFRSCGSGMGLGLAGIGIAWGLMLVGTRYAARVASKRDR
jgi:hypothetical protein